MISTDERLDALERRIAALEGLLDRLLDGRSPALTTEFLLDYYDQRIEPMTGKSLRGWLVEINALARYEAVKALRSRRRENRIEP